MKQELGLWMIFILWGIVALIAHQKDKNRKSFNDSLRRFTLLFTGVFLIVFSILFLVKWRFGLNILNNHFMQPTIWQWIFFILIGITALTVRQIDKNRRSFFYSFRRFVLLVWGVSSVIVGLWFLVKELFG